MVSVAGIRISGRWMAVQDVITRPPEQFVHAPAREGEYSPTPQLVHEADPAALHVPAGQSEHDALARSLYVPAGQVESAIMPVAAV